MKPCTSYYVGADVAKHSVLFRAAQSATIDNTLSCLLDYLRELPAGAQIICEATGRYHHALRQACERLGIAITCVNPAHARYFAKSHGKLEKTDPIDAALLRSFGEERHPAPTPPDDPSLAQLRDLLMVRSALVEDIGEQRKRDCLVDRHASTQLRAIIRVLQTRLLHLEKSLERWLDDHAAYQDKAQTLCLVCGVSILSALQLLAYLPELGTCNRRQIAKLAGLAPLADDSGTGKGLRRIGHGRPQARRVLYMCAVVAAHHNPVLAPQYKNLRAANKPAKAAYIAIARKLLVFLNSILRPTNPQHA